MSKRSRHPSGFYASLLSDDRDQSYHLKGHRKLVHMRITYHFLADLHITLHQKSRAEKRIL